MDEETAPVIVDRGWMSDVQRAIALILIGAFAVVTVFSTFCSVFWPEASGLIDMAKTLQQALVNMVLIALGFFFGSNMSSKLKDATISKIATGAPSSNGEVAKVITTTPAEASTTPTITTVTTEAPKGE